MSFEEYKAELALLLSQLSDQPQDDHEVLQQLHTMLNTFRAEGMPIPEDLALLEAELDARFTPPSDNDAS